VESNCLRALVDGTLGIRIKKALAFSSAVLFTPSLYRLDGFLNKKVLKKG